MFKKSITFEDLNGESQTQDFYFHMSKAELLALAADGNAMMTRIERMTKTSDSKAILGEFRDLIAMACGIRSEDGARFVKTPDAQSILMDSPAFDELLMELCTDADAAADFVRQLVPEKMQKEMQDRLKNVKTSDVPDPFAQPANDDPRPVWMKEERNPTQQELRDMSADELRLAFQHRK